MDIFGNLMLGCWFLFVSFMCVGCAYIIMRDKVPPIRFNKPRSFNVNKLKFVPVDL